MDSKASASPQPIRSMFHTITIRLKGLLLALEFLEVGCANAA